ncbi:MAG: hypothetical protein FWE12_01975 [Oscillospiraceae bacterium]|nr:hypothetical protein [Oscillospiraceae bacterium]
MELYEELLAKAIGKDVMRVTLPHLQLHAAEIVEQQSYAALQKIKAIIEDDSLDDFECVEQIVCVFERFGSDGGSRHDF